MKRITMNRKQTEIFDHNEEIGSGEVGRYQVMIDRFDTDAWAADEFVEIIHPQAGVIYEAGH